RAYKIAVFLPEEVLDETMEAVTSAITPLYPGYERVFSYYRVHSTWRSLEGSSPYNGEVDETTECEEIKLEFAVSEEDLPAAIAAVRSVHPYEEPAIDVLPMIPWKDAIGHSDLGL
ncbi:MAG: hypothetical protein IJ856_06310, partial [Candidatus Methanomethylophilaceae archaeon]|nr:hypothetical protein [Candidatus Methanomethylophilaceae archaeon]